LAAAETVKAWPEVPDVRSTHTHDVRELTDHDAWFVATTVEAELPAAANLSEVGERPTDCAPAACVTVYTANAPPDATTTWPDRATDVGFAPALTANAAPLAPDAGETDAHAGYDETDHGDRLVVTVVETDPPAPAIEPETGDTATTAGTVAVSV
jgi:hypothetical protein